MILSSLNILVSPIISYPPPAMDWNLSIRGNPAYLFPAQQPPPPVTKAIQDSVVILFYFIDYVIVTY